MYKVSVFYLVILSFAIANGSIFDFSKLQNYTRIFGFLPSQNSNELWHGIIKDCKKKVTFSCIQKNAYSYLDRTLADRDNITVFDGLHLTRNNLDYDACIKEDPKDNLVEDANGSEEGRKIRDNVNESQNRLDDEEDEEYLSPLEEVTHALRKKTIKFLVTRDYELQLPKFLGDGNSLKISPREIDDNGALIRIEFNNRAKQDQEQGRIFFKKIKKQIQNKLLMTFLFLILVIKIIKVKFMFVIPFLFGVGTAKKLFLKLLLFFVPAFAHVFKLCSSYYSSHATKYHLHHHKQIAHHHHHIPVPVPVPSFSKPVYYDHPPPPSNGPPGPPYILDEDFPGYDYAHPHIQYRKDIEELKEWGIEPYDESYDQVAPQAGVIYPVPMPAPLPPPGLRPGPGPKAPVHFARPPPPGFLEKMPLPPSQHPQSLAYAGYGPPMPPPPRSSASSLPVGVVAAPVFAASPVKAVVAQPAKQQSFAAPLTPQQQQQQQQPQQQQQLARPTLNDRQDMQQQASSPAAAAPLAAHQPTHRPYDDVFYGPIVERLDEIFAQLRFHEENCRERLVCSMYKNPTLYSPHSNLVSSELSRDPHELQQGNSGSASSQRFYRYLNAARLGQDGGDCLRSFHCSVNTE